MKKVLVGLLAAAALSGVGIASAFSFDGPFQVKNQFPIFLPVGQPYLESAGTGDSLSLSLSHSSVYVMEDSVQWAAHMDMELTELNLRGKKDLPGLFEIGIDVPVLRATAGFMDRPLAWYHRAFHFGDYGRSNRPRNDFLYDIRYNGMPVVEGDNDRVGFGDVRVTAKRTLLAGDGYKAGLQLSEELPTGNARVGYGNGSYDTGIALLLDADLADSTRLYANAGAVFPGKLRAYQTLDLRSFYYGGAAVEYRFLPSLSLLCQVMYQTSPYPETGISQIDTPAVLLVLGGRYYGASGSYEFSLTEDPNTSGAPDFILNLTYRRNF
jgi:hypothetical protein